MAKQDLTLSLNVAMQDLTLSFPSFLVQKLFAFARGDSFRARASQMGGYDVSGLGTVRYNGA